jgi:import inner membrane translocase subunit TIM13
MTWHCLRLQEAIFKLTELAFEKCVTRPGSSLSSSESNCLKQMTERYLDTSKFVVGRFQNQAQQQGGGGGGGGGSW